MSKQNIESLPIAQKVSSYTLHLFIVSTAVQILATGLFFCFLSYKDANRRASFLSQSNETALGLMISTGDHFQLRSLVSSFRSEDTPYVWLLDDEGNDLITNITEQTKSELPESKKKILWHKGDVLVKTENPIFYNGTVYGHLILFNKIRVNDWFTLSIVLFTVMIVFFFFQSKSLGLMSLSLGRAICGIGNFFDHADSESSLKYYAENRVNSGFSEIESISEQIFDLLTEIFQSVETEKEKEKFKALAQFSAHVAHDLRHPVSVFDALARISNWESYIAMKPELERSLARIENMIDGLRHSDAQRFITLIPDKLQLNMAVAEVRPTAREKGVILRCEGNTSEISTVMDVDKLVRALHNLMFNALEAGATEILVRCNLSETGYFLEIEDNGPGVPEAFISRLFTEGGTFGKKDGTGLGLTFVKKVILSHRGTIHYGRRDKATIFAIFIPIAPQMQLSHSKESQLISESDPLLDRANVRVLVQIADKEFEKKLIQHLSCINLLPNSDDLSTGDLIYSDQDTLVQLSLSKKISLLMHLPRRKASDVAQIILLRVKLMNLKSGYIA